MVPRMLDEGFFINQQIHAQSQFLQKLLLENILTLIFDMGDSNANERLKIMNSKSALLSFYQ